MSLSALQNKRMAPHRTEHEMAAAKKRIEPPLALVNNDFNLVDLLLKRVADQPDCPPVLSVTTVMALGAKSMPTLF